MHYPQGLLRQVGKMFLPQIPTTVMKPPGVMNISQMPKKETVKV